MVQSVPWQVEKLDWVGRKAYVTRTHVDYYTDAIDYSKLKVLAEFDARPSGAGLCGHGEVHVVRRVTGYKKIRYYTHENIGYGPINLPDQELQTTSVWWRLSPQAIDREFQSRFEAFDGFLGAAYALHTVATLLSMCEPRDLGKAVGSGDNDWSAQVSSKGRGEMRSASGRRSTSMPWPNLRQRSICTTTIRVESVCRGLCSSAARSCSRRRSAWCPVVGVGQVVRLVWGRFWAAMNSARPKAVRCGCWLVVAARAGLRRGGAKRIALMELRTAAAIVKPANGPDARSARQTGAIAGARQPRCCHRSTPSGASGWRDCA